MLSSLPCFLLFLPFTMPTWCNILILLFFLAAQQVHAWAEVCRLSQSSKKCPSKSYKVLETTHSRNMTSFVMPLFTCVHAYKPLTTEQWNVIITQDRWIRNMVSVHHWRLDEESWLCHLSRCLNRCQGQEFFSCEKAMGLCIKWCCFMWKQLQELQNFEPACLKKKKKEKHFWLFVESPTWFSI